MDGAAALPRDGDRLPPRSSRPSRTPASSPSDHAFRSPPTFRSMSPRWSAAPSTGAGAVWRTAGVQEGDRVAIFGCGGVGLSALMAAVAVGAEPVIAVDAAPKLRGRARFGATDGVEWRGSAEATAEAVREASGGGVDCDRGDGAARGDGGCIPLDAQAGRCSSSGFPRGLDAVDSRDHHPADGASHPRLDRLVEARAGLSSHARPLPRGPPPLDRLVTHRLPLEEAERGFELMHSGDAVRVVLEL